MYVRNLTPHLITLRLDNGDRVALPPDGPPARCRVDRTLVGYADAGGGRVPIYETRLVAGSADLPPPEPPTLLVVARVVAEAHGDRADLVYPDELERDEHGSVTGCRAFARTRTSGV